jgi:hypothetical protein
MKKACCTLRCLSCFKYLTASYQEHQDVTEQAAGDSQTQNGGTQGAGFIGTQHRGGAQGFKRFALPCQHLVF